MHGNDCPFFLIHRTHAGNLQLRDSQRMKLNCNGGDGVLLHVPEKTGR